MLALTMLFLNVYSPAKTIIYTQPELLSPSQVHILEIFSGHAWEEHGLDVNKAFQCLNRNGSTRSFKTSGFFKDTNGNKIPTNLWLCFNGKDWYAIVTTTFEKIAGNKVARLVTAYKISKESFPTIDSFITYIQENWFAREIIYQIKAGDLLLQPK